MRNNENLDRKIVLEDGTEIYGAGFGCRDSRVAELVFNWATRRFSPTPPTRTRRW